MSSTRARHSRPSTVRQKVCAPERMGGASLSAKGVSLGTRRCDEAPRPLAKGVYSQPVSLTIHAIGRWCVSSSTWPWKRDQLRTGERRPLRTKPPLWVRQ